MGSAWKISKPSACWLRCLWTGNKYADFLVPFQFSPTMYQIDSAFCKTEIFLVERSSCNHLLWFWNRKKNFVSRIFFAGVFRHRYREEDTWWRGSAGRNQKAGQTFPVTNSFKKNLQRAEDVKTHEAWKCKSLQKLAVVFVCFWLWNI